MKIYVFELMLHYGNCFKILFSINISSQIFRALYVLSVSIVLLPMTLG